MGSEATATRRGARDQPALVRLAGLLRPYKWSLIAALAMLVGLTGTSIAVPQLIGAVFDHVFGDSNFRLLGWILGGLTLLYIVKNALYFHSKYTAIRVGEDVCFQVRNQLFDRLQQMNLHFYRRTRPGSLSSRVMNDSFVIQDFIQSEVPKLMTSALLFLGVVAVIYATNWQLALACTVVLPLHLLTYFYFRKPIKRASRAAQEHLGDAHGNLIEKFLGIEVVKGFSGEKRESAAFQQATDLSRQSQLRSQRYHVMQKVAADLLIGLGTIFLLGFGAYQVVAGRLETGSFVAFWMYVGMLYPTVIELMSGFARLSKASASLDRVFEVLETPAAEDGAMGKMTREIEGAVAFRGVCFRYDDGPPVLDDVTFAAQPGQVVAITGPSGSGKSTLVSMVPRFNEPDAGQVLIDGIDASDYVLAHLRRAIGVAFQECFLFNSSVLENLRYAAPEAPREQIIDVAQRTGAHEMVMNLPQGYDTMLGETGVTLSRGQKQQIALTRALLKNPQILILDEATSSIDAARERQIVPAVLDFMRGKTTLMITHRPELLKHADVIVQMPDGRTVSEAAAQQAFRGEPIDPAARREKPEVVEPPRRRSKGSSGIWRSSVALALAALLGAAMMLAAPGAAMADAPAAEPEQEAAGDAADHAVDEPGDADASPPPAVDDEAARERFGHFLRQPGLSAVQAGELVEILTAKAQAQLGYRMVPRTAPVLPEPPSRLMGLTQLYRGERMLQLGYRPFQSQPPHVWVYGHLGDGEAPLRANDDVDELLALLGQGVEAIHEADADLRVAELETELVTLSYVEADRALGVLKSLGYATIEYSAGGESVGGARVINPSNAADTSNLPIIMALPGSDHTDIVPGAMDNSGNPRALPHTGAGPMMELMILYHPAKPEQLAEVRRQIVNNIDRPARQILIEAMVLEISETGLDALGVEWELSQFFSGTNVDNITELSLGRGADFRTGEGPTVEVEIGRVLGHFRTQLEALVRRGEAEILSRPSVLTLDNRQASINVGERIPRASSIDHLRADRVQFEVDYEEVGIFLNVRPRVSANADKVAMQIVGTVSAEVPDQELILRDADGQVVATAPRISERRVQTYALIANNTPFIIGGLISRDATLLSDRVPLLGDIPVLGRLFRSDRAESIKREVIIVITPYVLPEEQIVGRNIPKDDDLFDSVGNHLYRDAYRIRSRDVFDLNFLTQNRGVRRMQRVADRLVEAQPQLRYRYPFRDFADGRIPGEHVLVYRQMYNVGSRLGLDQRIGQDQVILFRPDEAVEAGFGVTFFDRYFEQATIEAWEARGHDIRRYPRNQPLDALGDEALAITFTEREDVEHAGEVMEQPVPELYRVHVPTRADWSRTLWELNQPGEDGRQRHTILIQSQRDLERIAQAVMLKQIVELNTMADRQMTLRNFTVGRNLLMPEIEDDAVFVLDSSVAEYFFISEMYYPILQQHLQQASEAMRDALDRPEYSRLLDPGRPRRE
ncbi:MAG: ABC transporter transmembrane domain-containing protein [Phycisphaeraceae bacterium]